MRRVALWLLWPGLAPLWLRGSGRGLAIAAAFGVLLNFALISTFVWPQLLSGSPPWVVPAAAWILVLWFWIVAARSGARFLIAEAAREQPPDDDRLLVQAQTEYLKGHLSEAERLLTQLLETDAEDAEARLLLATLCRRGGRTEEAEKHLTELIGSPQAAAWRMEIASELKLTRSADAREGKTTIARAA